MNIVAQANFLGAGINSQFELTVQSLTTISIISIINKATVNSTNTITSANEMFQCFGIHLINTNILSDILLYAYTFSCELFATFYHIMKADGTLKIYIYIFIIKQNKLM